MSLRLYAFALLALIAILPGFAGAQTARPLTVSVIYGPDKPQAKVWYRFQELIDERLPGQFAINVVTGGALGGERETAEGIRLGSIHGALSTLANLSAWVPEGQLFDMPFVFRDAEHIQRVMAGPIGETFKQRYAEQGFKALGFIIYGARHVIAKQPVETPADVAGKKMRVLQSDLHIDLWRSLDANPTPIPITEAYGALETGVVDFMDMTQSGYQALKLFEVVPYFSKTGHIWALGVMYLGMDYWQALNDEQREAFQAAADQAIPYFNELAAAEQDASLEAAVAAGATVVEPAIEPWREAMAAFWQDYAERVGGMEQIQAILDAAE